MNPTAVAAPPVTSSHCSYLVVKVASLCNLNCTYCYMYNLGDQTYRNQPKAMPRPVVEAMLDKTRTHCLRHNLTSFGFGLHGGEPLLAGKDFFRMFVTRAREVLLPAGVTPFFTVQTNAVLLTGDWCRLFEELDVHVGVSLDGDRETNDKYRLDHKGRGSYDRVVAGLGVLKKFPDLDRRKGVLSVIDINADPLKVYAHLVELGVKKFDILLPHANYDSLPVQPAGGEAGEAPYGDWLIRMFDYWFADRSGRRPKIRFFDDLINQVLGGQGFSDLLGSLPNGILVIETNGGIEPVDNLKICGDGFTKQGVNVLSDEFDDVFGCDLIGLYDRSHQMLCGKCYSCPIKNICGGGYLPHRYHHRNGFDNPSVYCRDLMKLIAHIQNQVIAQLPADFLAAAQLAPVTYEEIADYLDTPANVVASPYEDTLQAYRTA